MNYYGQISLTKLGDWVRKHPEQVKDVTFADGHTEKFINIDIRDRQQPGQHGSVAYISLYDKQSGEKEYIADLKVSQYGAAQTAAMPLQPAQAAVAQHPAYSAPYQPKNNRR